MVDEGEHVVSDDEPHVSSIGLQGVPGSEVNRVLSALLSPFPTVTIERAYASERHLEILGHLSALTYSMEI